jgi:hypothetical protein
LVNYDSSGDDEAMDEDVEALPSPAAGSVNDVQQLPTPGAKCI